ncbi:MAG: hypothetical protein HYY09_05475 [Firmicutes bacterium]|nr:hypothetical protein [Bacillota bacterium]
MEAVSTRKLSGKELLIPYLLLFFFGWAGGYKFYMGRHAHGLLYIGLSIASVLFFGGWIIVGMQESRDTILIRMGFPASILLLILWYGTPLPFRHSFGNVRGMDAKPGGK